MKFLSLAIEHFRTFRKRVALPLADLGLVLVRGNNLVSQAADSNGAGKSGILHALSWALFGRDLDGLGADDVACRFTKEPCVVDLAGESWIIHRGQRPSGLVLRDAESRWWTTAGWAAQQERGAEVVDGKAIQAKIDQLVGFGYRTFRNAVVFGQGAFERFAQAEQGEQMRMLDEIQGMDFRAALDRAKAWRGEWQVKYAEAADRIGLARQQREQAQRQAEELIAARAQFRDGKALRVKIAEDRLRQAVERLAVATQSLADARQKAKDAARLVEKWNRLKELKTDLEHCQRETEQREFVRDRRREEAENLGARTEALLQAGRCPTCRLEFTGKATAQVRMAFRPDLAAAQKAFSEAAAFAVSAAKVAEGKAAEVERHVKALPQVNDKVIAEALVAANPQTLQLIQRSWEQATAEQGDALAVVKAERSARWDGEAALAACEKERADAEEEERKAAQQATKAERTVAAAEYWVEAFGDRGLRSLLFDSVAGFLNDRVAAHLGVLAAGEADVEVSALAALKSGAVRERLSIKAAWGWGAGSYAAGSAGQDRRVDLALFAALQDLAESRSAKSFPIRVYDEPFDALDARGKEMAIQWVKRETAKRGTVFLITHSEELAAVADPDRVWTVVLDRDGSRVEVG